MIIDESTGRPKLIPTADLGQLTDAALADVEIAIDNRFVLLRGGRAEFTLHRREDGASTSVAVYISPIDSSAIEATQTGNRRAASEGIGAPALPTASTFSKAPNSSTAEGPRSDARQVAELREVSGRLLLNTTSGDLDAGTLQLANAILRLKALSAEHSVRLRSAEAISPVAIDLREREQRVALNPVAPPKLGELVVELTEVSGGSVPFTNEASTEESEGSNAATVAGGPAGVPHQATNPEPMASMEVGDRSRLVCDGDIPLEIDAKLVQDHHGLAVEWRLFYETPGKRRQQFVASRVTTVQRRLERTISGGTKKLDAARRAIPGLESAARASVTSSDPNQAAQQARRVMNAKRQLSRAKSAVRRFERAIPNAKQELQNLERVVALGRALHGKLTLHGRLYAQQGDERLLLAQF